MNQAAHVNAALDDYFTMWNVDDGAARRRLVERVWLPEAQSIDPLAAVTGWDAIESFVASVRQQYPTHRVEQSGPHDQHHDRLRFPWCMCDAAGTVVLTGIDCVRLAGDGRFAELVGFFDGPPPAVEIVFVHLGRAGAEHDDNLTHWCVTPHGCRPPRTITQAAPRAMTLEVIAGHAWPDYPCPAKSPGSSRA